MSRPLIEVRDVVKDFRGLRPLRVQQLDLQEHQSIALLGFDQATAEVLVNLITGAILPDTGSITVFGQLTSAIADAEAWVHTLDQFGLISERAVMLDQLTTEQNLALPLSLRHPVDARRCARPGARHRVGSGSFNRRTRESGRRAHSAGTATASTGPCPGAVTQGAPRRASQCTAVGGRYARIRERLSTSRRLAADRLTGADCES